MILYGKIYTETIIPAGYLTIDIVFSHAINYTLNAELKNISSITLGSDEDSDIIYFPGEIDIELYFKMDKKDLIEIMKYIIAVNVYNWVSVYLKLNNNLIWQGYLDKDPENLNLKGNVLKLKILDQTSRLKGIDPKTNPFGYNLDSTEKIINIIQDIFINIFNGDNYVNQIEIFTTLEGQIVIDYTNYLTFPFSEFRAVLSFYYSSDCNYEDILHVLKSICLNYNLIAYVGFNRILYLFPRFIEFNNIREITKNELLEAPDYDIIQSIKGMKAKIWKGAYPKNDDNNYYIKLYGEYDPDDESCEEIIIDQPAGSYPGGGYSGIAILYNSTIYWIEHDRIRYKKIDNTYSDYNALWYFVADETWNTINSPRMKCRIVVNGLYDSWNPSKYYKLYDSDILFRATKFEYDLLKNTTTLYLREVGIIPGSYRLLENGDYRLLEYGEMRMLEELGSEIVSEENFRITEDNYYRITEDDYNRILEG